MKLLTHNFLSSQFLKGVKTGYPLKLTATKTDTHTVKFNAAFVKRMIPKLDYPALVEASKAVKGSTAAAAATEADGDTNMMAEGADVSEIPEQMAADWERNEDFLKKVHHVLLAYDVIDGELQCPETGRRFLIREGIPNMLANEDEVE